MTPQPQKESCIHEPLCKLYQRGKFSPFDKKECIGDCDYFIQSRPHTSTPPQPDKFCEYQETCARTTSATCEYCEEAYSNKWKQHDAEIRKAERERVLCELLAYIHPDSRAGDVIKEKLESLRGEL